MSSVWKLSGIAALACLAMAGCGSQEEPAVSTPGSTVREESAEASATETIEPGLVVESASKADDLSEVITTAERAGLECEETEDSDHESHSVRVCDGSLLLVHFSDVKLLEGYVNSYVRRGRDVVEGDSWFVAGPPERIEPLVEGMTN